MRRIWALLLAAAWSWTACSSQEPQASDEARPLNLLVITLDTTRADALGVYGQELPTSPRIDAMAADGLLFEQALASSPSTLPSHSTLFTGRQPYTHGARSNLGYQLAEQNLTLAEVLQAAGYTTAAEIASAVMARDRNLDQGFDAYHDPGNAPSGETEERTGLHRLERDAESITAGGLRFLREHADRPFFLWLHYFDAHTPYDPPERFRRRIPNEYLAEVAWVDHNVGVVLDEIQRLGLRSRTLVLLAGDHGEGNGDHGESSHSFFVYDSTMQVPLIFWGANSIPRGARVPNLVRLVDLTPTALDLLGMEPLADSEGVSLRPLLADPTQDLSLVAYGESIEPVTNFDSSVLRFVREGRWKYIHKLAPELYDIQADPGELRNLAESRPDIVEKLRGHLRDMIAAGPARLRAAVEPDEATLDQLQALGYVGGPSARPILDEFAALEVRPPDPSSRREDIWKLGQMSTLLEAKRFGEMERLMREVVANNPRGVAPLTALIGVLKKQGRERERVPLLRRAVELDPDSVDQRMRLARSLNQLGELDQAADVLDQLVTLEPCADRTRLLLANLRHSQERYAEQKTILERANSSCADSVRVRNALAYALATSPIGAVRDGQRALQLAESVDAEARGRDADYLDSLACAYAEVGRFDQALEAIERAIALLGERAASAEVTEIFQRHRASFVSHTAVRDP
jgi:arylsulfatase A-like enzyme/Flp pilus assembly protein TadD